MALKNIMMSKNLTNQDLVHCRKSWLTISFLMKKIIGCVKAFSQENWEFFWKPYFLLEKAILVCHFQYTIHLCLRDNFKRGSTTLNSLSLILICKMQLGNLSFCSLTFSRVVKVD